MASGTKHVVIIAHHYPPHLSGVGVVAQSQARRLVALGYRVTVITSDTAHDEKSRIEDGVDVVRIPAWNISERWGAPFPIFSPSLFAALVRNVRRADIVHIHDSLYLSSFWGMVIAKIFRKPIVLTQHIALIAHPAPVVMTVQRMVYATAGTMMFRLADRIFTFNDRIEKFLLDRGVPPEKISALPNGVDTELFRPASPERKAALRRALGFREDEKIVLFVGRPVPKKGFDKVTAAADGSYRIACVGGGDTPVEERADITFFGRVSHARLAEIYQAADLFLLPSESEGFPLSIQEAMASGLPVVTTNDEGYRRYGLDKNFVALLDKPDPVSIKTAVHGIISDEARQKAMGAYSRSYAEERFGWPSIISSLDKHYKSLAI